MGIQEAGVMAGLSGGLCKQESVVPRDTLSSYAAHFVLHESLDEPWSRG